VAAGGWHCKPPPPPSEAAVETMLIWLDEQGSIAASEVLVVQKNRCLLTGSELDVLFLRGLLLDTPPRQPSTLPNSEAMPNRLAPRSWVALAC